MTALFLNAILIDVNINRHGVVVVINLLKHRYAKYK